MTFNKSWLIKGIEKKKRTVFNLVFKAPIYLTGFSLKYIKRLEKKRALLSRSSSWAHFSYKLQIFIYYKKNLRYMKFMFGCIVTDIAFSMIGTCTS
jgi:hypothetical protein